MWWRASSVWRPGRQGCREEPVLVATRALLAASWQVWDKLLLFCEHLFSGFQHGADDGTGTPALGVLAACSQGGAGPRWAHMGIPIQSLGLQGPLASPGAVSFGEQSKWEGLAVAARAGPF